MWMCFAFDLDDDAVRLFGLTAEYAATLNQPLKIGGYADTQTVDFKKEVTFRYNSICVPPINHRK